MKLLLGSLLVGEISNPYFCDQTWFGILLPDVGVEKETVGQRITAYKKYSEEWHDRLEANQASPPDDSEWNEFRDLLESPEWKIVHDADGIPQRVICPGFFQGGEFTTRPWDFVHSKE